MPTITPEAILQVIRDHEIVEWTETLTSGADLFSHGLDSMAVMQLLLLLETQFGVGLAPSDLTRENLSTAKAIAACLEARASLIRP